MIWHQFFARVKGNHRRVYSRVLVKMCAVAMTTGLVKNKASKMVFVYLKKMQWLEFQEIWAKNSLETT